MCLVDAAMEKTIEAASREIFSNFKGDFVKFVKESSKIKSSIAGAVHAVAQGKLAQGFELTEHVRKSIQESVVALERAILAEAFASVTRDNADWHKFSSQFERVKGPLLDIAHKRVPCNKNKYVSIVQHSLQLSGAALKTIVGAAELIKVKGGQSYKNMGTQKVVTGHWSFAW